MAMFERFDPQITLRSAISENENSKQYEVHIQQCDNGFIVNVGCKKLVFTSLKELLKATELFYTDFKKAKDKYLGKDK